MHALFQLAGSKVSLIVPPLTIQDFKGRVCNELTLLKSKITSSDRPLNVRFKDGVVLGNIHEDCRNGSLIIQSEILVNMKNYQQFFMFISISNCMIRDSFLISSCILPKTTPSLKRTFRGSSEYVTYFSEESIHCILFPCSLG
jgi:hypothetical protein